ncbi:glycosyltransferase family 2 protein [Microbacterium imperiale]|nr:glycosyltransferase family 2 protein [Microbacterium imperiale]
MLSIVVPAYNLTVPIQQCLRSISISGHGEERFEVVVVDDCSTDDTAERARQLIAELRLPGIVRSTSINSGVGEARKLGAQLARGRCIWFVDGDDVVTRPAVATALAMAAQLRDHEFGYFFQFERLDDIGNPMAGVRFRPGKLRDNEDVIVSYLRGTMSQLMWDKILPRHEILPHLSSRRTREEAQTMATYLPTVRRVRTSPIAAYGYRQRRGSLTNAAHYTATVLSSQAQKREELEILVANSASPRVKRAERAFWSRNAVSDALTLARIKGSVSQRDATYRWRDLIAFSRSAASGKSVLLAGSLKLSPRLFNLVMRKVRPQ